MPNTVYGPYSQTAWANGSTALSQTTMNNLEKQASIALNGFNGDLCTPFVENGVTSAKDGTIANQLDVASGRAYTTMSDGSLGLIIVGTTTFTTSTPSTTYYLFLLNTGAWQWGTTSTGPANSLAICQVTTDASGNIATVTDKRPQSTTLFPNATGSINMNGGKINADSGKITSDGAGNLTVNGTLTVNSAQATIGTSTTNNTNLTINRATAGEILDLSNYGTPNSNVRVNLDATGAVISSDLALRFGAASFIGFKTNGGTKLAQIGAIPSHGAADMAIGGSTYWTTQASAGFNNSASFSSFDVAEVYATDQEYPDGTVVCPQGGVMRRCTHDGCHAAMIVSKEPGFAIGDPAVLREAGETCELLALAGRKRVTASGGPIRERQLVSSDGTGGARAMRPGERGWALGLALAASGVDGSVGIEVRAAYCEIPCDCRTDQLYQACAHHHATLDSVHAAHREDVASKTAARRRQPRKQGKTGKTGRGKEIA